MQKKKKSWVQKPPLKVNRQWACEQYAMTMLKIYSSMLDNAKCNRRRAIAIEFRAIYEVWLKGFFVVAQTKGEDFDDNKMPEGIANLAKSVENNPIKPTTIFSPQRWSDTPVHYAQRTAEPWGTN